MDDDPPLLRTMGVFLSRLGYEVAACQSGSEALAELRRQPGAYAVLVTDMTLEDMPATQLAEESFQLDPNLRFVVTSGYPIDLPSSPQLAGVRIAALQKPFSPEMLASTIEQILAAPPEC